MDVRVVTVHLPEAYIEAIDQLVKRRMYPNRAEAIRMAVRAVSYTHLTLPTNREV